MEQWRGKIAVVTGASSGIGAATALDLVKAGMIVVGIARRPNQIEALRDQLHEDLRPHLHALKCDVASESQIVSTFALIEERFGGVDVLINNAGIYYQGDLTEPNNSEMVHDIVNTNLLAPVFCTREAIQSMKKRGNYGHVVHINSIVGHYVPPSTSEIPSYNMYAPSKYGVTAMTEVMRQELIKNKSKIKVTSISPGEVRTAMNEGLPADFPALESVDISQCILYVLGTPPRVQIHEIIIKPNGELI